LELGDNELRLPHGESAANHDVGKLMLVATWQLAHGHGRTRREQAESHIGLHDRIQGLDEHQASKHPAFVAAESSCNGGLRQVILAVQGPDQPGFLELGKPASVVQRDEQDLGLGPVDLDNAGAKRGKAERASGAYTLEAIDDLQLPTGVEHAERVELAMPLERPAHGFERRGLAEAQRRELVAEVGEVDVTLVVVGVVHAADCTTGEVSAAMVMRDARPDPG
jgi:hypothetical protein